MEHDKRNIAILGSTGSIGCQALEVVRRLPEVLCVEVLTAGNQVDTLIAQAKEFKPNAVVIGSEDQYPVVAEALQPLGIKVFAGEKALASIVEMESIDIVLTALVGYTGLLPTIKAIEAGKTIALANKETLVVAGELITKLAVTNGVRILPVDSEHSAIFQCLVGEFNNPIEKVILTASGGPFLGKNRQALRAVTKVEALRHPNWNMGAKVTIDSATLMNKGLEVIEAHWLFDVQPDQLEVVIHPQSIVHSMVQFEDGSLKAQLGQPDMRLPIQFALTYPDRLQTDLPRLSFTDGMNLTFEAPDTKTFRNLELAYAALRSGGNRPCILNAANEVAVSEFLADRIGFLEIEEVVERCLEKVDFIEHPGYGDYVYTDNETRIRAREFIASSSPV